MNVLRVLFGSLDLFHTNLGLQLWNITVHGLFKQKKTGKTIYTPIISNIHRCSFLSSNSLQITHLQPTIHQNHNNPSVGVHSNFGANIKHDLNFVWNWSTEKPNKNITLSVGLTPLPFIKIVGFLYI